MSRNFNPQMSHPESLVLARSRGGAIYTHPDDVASDPELTLAEKRAVLASWISDARAVENAPSLRRLDSGAVVEVDAILRALVSLDQRLFGGRYERKKLPPLRGRRSLISRWLSRVGAQSSNDNDDDPPPAPAGIGVPFRPIFVAAHGARPERAPVLAFATR
jgi:hypothetical protein